MTPEGGRTNTKEKSFLSLPLLPHPAILDQISQTLISMMVGGHQLMYPSRNYQSVDLVRKQPDRCEGQTNREEGEGEVEV
jgi:hypothetical protein